jgi:hypothetical protein
VLDDPQAPIGLREDFARRCAAVHLTGALTLEVTEFEGRVDDAADEAAAFDIATGVFADDARAFLDESQLRLGIDDTVRRGATDVEAAFAQVHHLASLSAYGFANTFGPFSQ